MSVIKKLTIIIAIFQIFLQNYCHCSEDVPKSYYVKPIDVVCDYPFNDTTKWAVTCRVWGLLKYYHPNVTAGKLDWDQVLLDRMDKIREADSPEQVNAELIQMIRIAGEYEFQTDDTWNDSLNMNVNLCWLDHSFINDSIRQELRRIASLTVTNYWYHPQIISSGTPNNEKEYHMGFSVPFEYQMLALFKYWNVIYYFFPYKYLMDQSWDATLSEFIPIFQRTADGLFYRKAIAQLASQINDGHGFTSVLNHGFHNPFNYITLIDSSTVVRNPHQGSLLERGDIILSINKNNIGTFRDSTALLIPSSHKRYTDYIVNGIIYGLIMNGCNLTVKRNCQIITLNERTRSYHNEVPAQPHYAITQDVYYVNLGMLHQSDIADMTSNLKNYRGAILDLRHSIQINPWDLLPYLFQTQKYCYGLAMYADLSHPGAFEKKELMMGFPDELWQSCEKYSGKIAVLINETTMSTSETWAMSFRINSFTLVGTPTAGANGNVTILSLPGNITAYYSGLGFYFPDGTQTQRTGIIPDIEVFPTMDDILAGRDEVLEAAINYLNSN